MAHLSCRPALHCGLPMIRTVRSPQPSISTACAAGLFASGERDEARGSARFRRVFRLEQSQMVCWYGQDIGWFQMSETDRLVRLHQLHIVQELRNRGIGSSIVEAALQITRDGSESRSC